MPNLNSSAKTIYQLDGIDMGQMSQNCLEEFDFIIGDNIELQDFQTEYLNSSSQLGEQMVVQKSPIESIDSLEKALFKQGVLLETGLTILKLTKG